MGQAVNLYMTQQGVRLVIPATQGENLAREYDITVIGLDGQPVDLTGTTVSMYVIKRGGETVQIAATVSGNVATVVLPSGACDTPGDNACFIQVIKPDVYDLRVDNVILRVIPCDLDSAGTASEEFGTLTQLIADAQTAISNANTAAGNANAAAEEATSTAETTATSVATTVATSTAASVINEQKGQANGLATLDSTGKLTQMPSAADVGAIPSSEKGAANGVAALDSSGKLPVSALPDGVQMVDDTGWQTPVSLTGVVVYNEDSANQVRYRRKNGVVTVTGVVSPASNDNDFGSSTQNVIFTLPVGYRPATNYVTICQGTSTDIWTLIVNANGTVCIARYRDETGYKTPTTTTWMPFTATFLTA